LELSIFSIMGKCGVRKMKIMLVWPKKSTFQLTVYLSISISW